MIGIELHNFRRFKELPFLEFGKITFLVGSNSSGKSSVSKAIAFLVNNIIKMDVPSLFYVGYEFDFSNQLCADLNIVDFNHTLYFSAEDRTISLGVLLEDIYMKFDITQSVTNGNKQTGRLSRIQITNPKVNFVLYPGEEKCRIDFNDSMSAYPAETLPLIKHMVDWRRDDYNLHGYGEYDNPAYGYDFMNYESIMSGDLDYHPNGYTNGEFCEISKETETLRFTQEQSSMYNQHCIARDIQMMVERCKSAIWNGVFKSDKDAMKRVNCEMSLNFLANDLQRSIGMMNIAYIPMSIIPQLTAYSTDSTNTSKFANLLKDSFAVWNDFRYEPAKKFIRKWMNEFKIGSDYKIDKLSEEVYRLTINQEPNHITDATSLGKGPLQLMTLLLHIGKVIERKTYKSDEWMKLVSKIQTRYLMDVSNIPSSPLIVVEEPELCLHPCYQKMLADMMLEATTDFDIHFIVETHSEYLIRHTQVLVAGMNLGVYEMDTKNPFKVYYFPGNRLPYDMEYCSDGHFKKTFEDGFFDVSNKSTIELIWRK